MLKLISALEADIKSVKDYDKSYLKSPQFACYAVVTSRSGANTYYEYVSNYNPNMYYLVDDANPDYILGYGDIEDGSIDYHGDEFNKGHIEYDIRPSERGKGYGNAILPLLLEKCEEMGFEEICISCHKDNILSKKIIENNNGVLEKEFKEKFGSITSLKYWIKLNPQNKKTR